MRSKRLGQKNVIMRHGHGNKKAKNLNCVIQFNLLRESNGFGINIETSFH